VPANGRLCLGIGDQLTLRTTGCRVAPRGPARGSPSHSPQPSIDSSAAVRK
jgi:hypothetical protein